MTKFAIALLAASAAFAAPAFAQDSAVTLRVDSGTVLTSSGGEFESANTGKVLSTGDKVTVNAGSSATLVYDGGCTVSFNAPGVYDVPAACKAGWTNSGGNNTMNAAIIVGAGVIGAALLNAEDEVPVGPLTTSVRHL